MQRFLVRSFGAVLVVVASMGGPRALAGSHAVASAHPLATDVGNQIMAAGGNAFDAAVAVAAALAVVEPFSSGLGGGGFFLLHRAQDGLQVTVDARETAPAAVTPETFLGADDKPDIRAVLDGARSAGIPGTPAGMDWIVRHYASLPLRTLLAPAIRLAREGFAVDSRYVAAATFREGVMRAHAPTAAVFLDQGGVPAPGFLIKQPQLARVLEAMAAHGASGFYQGEIAHQLVTAVRQQGGIWSEQDLANYQVIERSPLVIGYRDARVTCVTLPSSGCLVLAQALQILQRFDLSQTDSTRHAHLLIEALRRGYQDRVRYMGDPDFVEVPVERLASAAYADQRAASIDLERATGSEALDGIVREGSNTTHFSIVDGHGNRVAATLSVNLPFGAGVVAGDTGVLLNDTMNDFAIGASVATAYSLTGSAANAVAPGKRPLSSMTPTFVESARGVLVIGTPGGSRIITMLLLALSEALDRRPGDIEHAVALPRFHHQYMPDRVEYEPGVFSAEWVDRLKAMGHNMQEGKRRWGNMQAVYIDRATGTVTAYGDPRGKVGVLF